MYGMRNAVSHVITGSLEGHGKLRASLVHLPVSLLDCEKFEASVPRSLQNLP